MWEKNQVDEAPNSHGNEHRQANSTTKNLIKSDEKKGSRRRGMKFLLDTNEKDMDVGFIYFIATAAWYSTIFTMK